MGLLHSFDHSGLGQYSTLPARLQASIPLPINSGRHTALVCVFVLNVAMTCIFARADIQGRQTCPDQENAHGMSTCCFKQDLGHHALQKIC